MEIAYQLKLLVLRQKWKYYHVLLQFEVTTTKTNNILMFQISAYV